MKSKIKKLAAVAAALTMTASLGGCAVAAQKEPDGEQTDITEQLPDTELDGTRPPEVEAPPATDAPSTPSVPEEPPKAKTVSYITTTTNGVNLRSGAGTNYAVKGTAEHATLYANNGTVNGWYKTGYKNGSVYLSAKYGKTVEMTASEDERIEAVIGHKAFGHCLRLGRGALPRRRRQASEKLHN